MSQVTSSEMAGFRFDLHYCYAHSACAARRGPSEIRPAASAAGWFVLQTAYPATPLCRPIISEHAKKPRKLRVFLIYAAAQPFHWLKRPNVASVKTSWAAAKR